VVAVVRGRGSDNLTLRQPTSAALAADGVLFVVDQGNHRMIGLNVP
jgi:hypothetical protein